MLRLVCALRTLVVMLALVAFFLPAAVIAQGGAQPQRGGTLVMVVQPEPPTLAAYASTSGPIGQVTTKVYEGLLEYDFNLKPIPGLAKSWTVSPDGKTITFKLQEGVKFHDGQPFTSEDVKFTILDVLKKAHPRGISTFRSVESIDTPDPLTVVIHLSEPAPYMLMALSGYESPMLPKRVFGTGDIANHPNANKPIGTGPYKFVEWQKGSSCGSTAIPTTGKRGGLISTASSRASLPTAARAQPRSRRRKRTSRASARCCRST